MAQIVPLPHPITSDIAAQDNSTNDHFDVVVFLEHFKSIDSLSNQLMDHFETEACPQVQPEKVHLQNLVFQLPDVQLEMSLKANTR